MDEKRARKRAVDEFSVEELSGNGKSQLEEGLRILARIILRAYRKDMREKQLAEEQRIKETEENDVDKRDI